MHTLAFYHAKDKLSHRLINWWTGGYSHVEYFDPISAMCWSSSSKEDGVRKKYIDFTNGRWTLVQYDFPFKCDPVGWFENHEGSEYDWNSILNYVWNMFVQQPSQFNCSVAIAQSLGFHIDRITPQELFEFLLPYRVQTVTWDGIDFRYETHPKPLISL